MRLPLLAKFLHSVFSSNRELAQEILELARQRLIWTEISYRVRYNSVTMKREKAANLFKSAYSVIATVVVLLGELLRSVVSLLASGTENSDTNEASDNAARGGVLNYRTGRFDDGTDAGGWYEND